MNIQTYQVTAIYQGSEIGFGEGEGLDVVLSCYQVLYNAGVKSDDKLLILLSDIRKSDK